MNIAIKCIFCSLCIDNRTRFLFHCSIEEFLLHTEIKTTINVCLLSHLGRLKYNLHISLNSLNSYRCLNIKVVFFRRFTGEEMAMESLGAH